MKKTVSRGGPSGFVVSLLFHVGIFFIAGLFVVFTVARRPEPAFEPAPPVERPKMKLKKPKVKVRKSSNPKPSSRIVAKVKSKKMPDIQLPDLEGYGEGLMGGVGLADGFIDLPELQTASFFGRTQSVGWDFEGHLYQLSHNRSGGAASMDQDGFRILLRDYVLKGWDDSLFERYYRFPNTLYATYFMVPPIPSPLAPQYFGAPEMECYYMFAVYKGKLVYHKDVRIRFWGIGDAYLFVNVDGKEVLVSGWGNHVNNYFNWWRSDASQDNIYRLGNFKMSVGDWIELKAGEPVDMNVLFGEWKGGIMSAGLLVEVEGEEYPKSHWNGPLLPVFKTERLTWDDRTQIAKYLPEDECSLTGGPVFQDFDSDAPGTGDDYDREEIQTVTPDDPEPADPEPVMRRWTLKDGTSFVAKYDRMLFDDVVLADNEGREIRVPPERLGEEDRAFVQLRNPPELDIEFSRDSKQHFFAPELFSQNIPPEAIKYQFTAKIRKASRSGKMDYDFPLSVEFFAIGDQIMADKRVLLDHRTATFTLSEENDFSFSLPGKEVMMLDFQMNRMRRGTRYGGYLVVVRDQRGVVIAHKETSKNLFENIENLSRLKTGWYFDDDCRRCLPKRPRHWEM